MSRTCIYLAILDNDTAHSWVGVCLPQSACGEVYRLAHVGSVLVSDWVVMGVKMVEDAVCVTHWHAHAMSAGWRAPWSACPMRCVGPKLYLNENVLPSTT